MKVFAMLLLLVSVATTSLAWETAVTPTETRPGYTTYQLNKQDVKEAIELWLQKKGLTGGKIDVNCNPHHGAISYYNRNVCLEFEVR